MTISESTAACPGIGTIVGENPDRRDPGKAVVLVDRWAITGDPATGSVEDVWMEARPAFTTQEAWAHHRLRVWRSGSGVTVPVGSSPRVARSCVLSSAITVTAAWFRRSSSVLR